MQTKYRCLFWTLHLSTLTHPGSHLTRSWIPNSLGLFLPIRLVCEDVSFCFAVLMAAEPLSELEAAIETVVTTFFTFAGREGRKGSLSLNEFKELVTQQLPHLLKVGRGLWD